jgi:hypothetical protein
MDETCHGGIFSYKFNREIDMEQKLFCGLLISV